MKSTPKNRRYGDGRAAFFGCIEAAQKWIDEGRTLKSFYDEKEGALGITYSQFVRHARTYLRRATRNDVNIKAPPSPRVVSNPTQNQQSKPVNHLDRAGPVQFQHSPIVTDTDDLI